MSLSPQALADAYTRLGLSTPLSVGIRGVSSSWRGSWPSRALWVVFREDAPDVVLDWGAWLIPKAGDPHEATARRIAQVCQDCETRSRPRDKVRVTRPLDLRTRRQHQCLCLLTGARWPSKMKRGEAEQALGLAKSGDIEGALRFLAEWRENRPKRRTA